MGEYTMFGAALTIDPYNIPPAAELRDLITRLEPNAGPETVEISIAHLYDEFLNRLLAFLFPGRPLSPTDKVVIERWLGDRAPNSGVVERAAERHAHRVSQGGNTAVDGAESVAATDLSWASDEDAEGDTMDSDDQTLQRTLYHIAEHRAKQEGVIHRGITCNGCDEKPIRGVRWHCANCVDFDLCSNCEATNSHLKTHIFYKIRVPAPYLAMPKQTPLYPGKPHMMSPSIDSPIKKRLVTETRMEAEEIEALWDQFTCLAGTEWTADSDTIGWAIDRRAFNHAFVPRYSSFVPAPNLIYDRIFAYYDTDKNGLIGFEEWIKGLNGMHATDNATRARIVFNGYDIDGDGCISRKDILRIFRAYYAIEKEAARNYVAEITEELSVRNALDTVRSSQPLGSAFPANVSFTRNHDNSRLQSKQQDESDNTSPVLYDEDQDVADRDEMLKVTDIHNIMPGELSQSEQDRIVTNRWARRQYYVDEEEGLTRPQGVDDSGLASDALGDEVELAGDSENPPSQHVERPRWSRSSSRVRFQDDVDVETRSNASTSSRPVGERWGGYEIPEPEKDLGKEVLYQITQQGFNELLNPIFQENEDNAMDAFATRSERRKRAAEIDEATDLFKVNEPLNKTICRVGIFRFVKCFIDVFCKILNEGRVYDEDDDNGHVYGSIKQFFEDSQGAGLNREAATIRLELAYVAVEAKLIHDLDSTKNDELVHDDMSLWNTWLCRHRFQQELLGTVLECVAQQGWICTLVPVQLQPEEQKADVHTARSDPTLPQFRPNSLTEIDAAESAPTNSLNTATDSRAANESSVSEAARVNYYQNDDDTMHLAADPQGPFFTLMSTEMDESSPEDRVEVPEEEESLDTAPILSSSTPPVPPTSDALPGDTAPELDAVPPPATSTPSTPNTQPAPINIRNYTNTPAIGLFSITTTEGRETLKATTKIVTHSTNPYHPEMYPQKPLERHIRQVAMDPDSPLHATLLASLEAVEQQISERKGSGLLNFDEFEAHMKEGRLRFLESWMDWVSF
ncbi:EF-hand [Dothidotthia symphoricarpi CBS 119687]|uniref:EF-hand n=1 Tax=Dothidotthia symphoricarpi CBS 119687 TaxID=1392245 RepID=A0A6A6AN61_9PLEO|nr:EF-hand [Dothidotthia symphoricarpi CBS 119687]KAF2132374.1 EF-hand [Dothidotthia symphoricarpi CBS 119687]